MALWLVRAGSNGETENAALQKDLVTIGWDISDLRKLKTREAIRAELLQVNPSASQGNLTNVSSQIWRFANEIKKDDLVVLPLKTQPAIAIGRITSDYEYTSDMGYGVHHIRRVKWIRKDIARTSFDQDLLYSFGAFMTVCQITRNDAENRVKAFLEGKSRPLLSVPAADDSGEQVEANVEELANDQIMKLISRKFRGHGLALLVDEILKAKGYQTYRSPPGPDGGVDILASSGDMGLGSPRVVVQVKSQDKPVDVEVLHELQSTMGRLKADSGLLVSFGGFSRSLLNSARDSFFSIRMWDSQNLLHELFASYEKLSEGLQAEIPLKKVHVLVPEE